MRKIITRSLLIAALISLTLLAGCGHWSCWGHGAHSQCQHTQGH